MNLQENIQRIKQMMGLVTEGLHDTYWQNEEGDKITLIDEYFLLVLLGIGSSKLDFPGQTSPIKNLKLLLICFRL